MDISYSVKPIGRIRSDGGGFRLELDPAYRPAMAGLEGFGYLNIFWWFSGCDDARSRENLVERSPYVKGPERLGVFATRSPMRPNPLALSCAAVTRLDPKAGVIGLSYIDAEDGSPLLDLKPYTPSLDRVEDPPLPAWCAHWPRDVESSGDFPWEDEFNF